MALVVEQVVVLQLLHYSDRGGLGSCIVYFMQSPRERRRLEFRTRWSFGRLALRLEE